MACGKPLENKGAVSLAENCSSINWLEQNNQKWTSGRIYNKKKYCQQHCKWQLNYLWIMNSNHEEGDFCSVVTSAVELPVETDPYQYTIRNRLVFEEC